MGCSCLADLGKTCAEKLIKKALAELRYVFCLTCIANEFEEGKGWLEAELKTLEQRAKVAAERDKDILANVHHWKEKGEKLVQEDIKKKQTCFFGLCPDCIWRYKRGKELANNIKEIKHLINKGEKFENIELPRHLPGVERFSSKDYISFPSRVSNYNKLLNALKDDNNYIAVLQGMGGTGKSTLAIEVGKELKKSEQFAYVIDTTVSFKPDIKKIQDDIAGCLGLKWEDCNDSDRPKRLLSRLTNGDKVLLIMDDVWDRDPLVDFHSIGIPKKDNRKGCRVLITTHSEKIFNKMDCDKKIKLGLLSEEEAWVMFKTYAGISNSSSKYCTTVGRKIATQCKQLPVAIAIIARSLKGQQERKHKWDATLKSLTETVSIENVNKEKVGIYKCLKSSYDHMEDEEAKGLFLLSSLFQGDKAIPIGLLTRLGIGTGLFGKNCVNYSDARNIVSIAIDKLIDSCLLVGVGKKHVKMHDLVREATRWVACGEIRHVNLSNKDEKSSVEKEENMKYLFCEGKDMDLFSWKYDGSKLETLILDLERHEKGKCMKAPNYFFENIDQLQVLYISYHDERPRPLPHSISLPANIRSILVERVDLGDISFLGNLQSLETLDLIDCIINELPREIAKLGGFKLLSLDNCKIGKNDPFEVIKSCSTLQELYFRRSFNGFCGEIILPRLQSYHISNGRGNINNSLSKYVSFIAGDGDKGFFSTETFKDIMQTIEGLELNGIKIGWTNLMPEIVPIDQGMKDLVELRLRCFSQLECLVNTHGFHLPEVLCNLVRLYLNKMQNLKELFHGPLLVDSLKHLENISITECTKLDILFGCDLNLCNLKTVKVRGCPSLVNGLFPLLTSQSLVLLENLMIKNCMGLKNIVIGDGDREDKSHGPMFPKLRVLHIESCNGLEKIFPFLSLEDFPVLEVINITKCDELKYIFGQYQRVEVISLKEVKLEKLPNFMGIFPEYSHSMSSVKNESSSKAQTQVDPIKCNILSLSCLRSSASVSSSRNRLQIWNHAQCFQVQSLNLCNVKEITLSGISKIKSVFILSITPTMLVETISISDCDELMHIIVDIEDDDRVGKNVGNVFPKLKKLYIEVCQQLEYIFGHYTDDHPNNNEIAPYKKKKQINLHLPELEDLTLRYLPKFVAMCPQQYCITFSPLKHFDLAECSIGAIKSIGDFIYNHSDSKSPDKTITKKLSGSTEHFIALESLVVRISKAENIFRFNGIEGQPINLGLQKIELHDENVMVRLFVGPINFFSLQNLREIYIVDCEKLKIVFSNSISPCLSQLSDLTIENCKELKHIIEDDTSNSLSSRTFFPKLENLIVIRCHKLKCVFPVSMCKELPKLKVLVIRDADELEEIFKTNGDQKVKIPNLNSLVFADLPSLLDAQGSHFQLVKNRSIRNCPKLLSLTPASEDEPKALHTSNETPSAETTKDSVRNEVETTLRVKLTSTQLENEQSIIQQGAIKPSQAITDEPPKQLVSPNKLKGVEEWAALRKANTTTTSTNSELVGSSQMSELDVDVRVSREAVKLNDDKVSLNDDVAGKETSTEQQFSKEEDKVVSEASNFSTTSQFPSMPSKEDPSQKEEELSSSLLVTRELEQLVSKKYLDNENLSLLTDFLAKHSSVLLKDNSLSNRYKGYAYNCLAELLKFLQSHSVLDVSVSGASHIEFVELVQDVRRCPFDKEWLNDVEKRILFTGLQISQAALQKLLDSKHILNEHVKDLKHQLTSSEAVLESITQQEAQISQNQAALSHPIGY